MRNYKNFFLATFAFSVISAWAQSPAEDILMQMNSEMEVAPTANASIAPAASTPEASIDNPVNEVPAVENAATEVPVAETVAEPAPAQTAEPVAEPTPANDPYTISTTPADTSGQFTPDPAFQQIYTGWDNDQQAKESTPVQDLSVPQQPKQIQEETPEAVVAAERVDPRYIKEPPPHFEPKEPHALDMLHGDAYNMVGNEAAAPTVAGEMSMPHKMYGRKFAYLEPVESYGTLSFGEATTFFLSFNNGEVQNTSEMGIITAGFARRSFGMSLQASIGKSWNYIDDEISLKDSTEKTTAGGNLVGGIISGKIGSINIAAQATYKNPDGITYISGSDTEEEFDNWAIDGRLSVSQTLESSYAWAFNLNILRNQAKLKKTNSSLFEEDGVTYISTHSSSKTDTTSRIELVPELNMGKAVLQNPKARIFLGLNMAVPLTAYDVISGVVSRHNEYGFNVTPNALAEAALGKYVMAFGSVSYCWKVAEYRDSYINSVSIKSLETESGETTTVLGLRLQYEYAALEMAFTQQFLQNPFGSFSDHEPIAMSIGAFVTF